MKASLDELYASFNELLAIVWRQPHGQVGILLAEYWHSELDNLGWGSLEYLRWETEGELPEDYPKEHFWN